MARDWADETSVRNDIHERMNKYGDNIAPVPFAEYQERRNDGLWWCVDIHIKVRRTTEFEVSAEGRTLSEALRKAYLGLNNEPVLTRKAANANALFGVTV